MALKSDVHRYPFIPDGCRLKDTFESLWGKGRAACCSASLSAMQKQQPCRKGRSFWSKFYTVRHCGLKRLDTLIISAISKV